MYIIVPYICSSHVTTTPKAPTRKFTPPLLDRLISTLLLLHRVTVEHVLENSVSLVVRIFVLLTFYNTFKPFVIVLRVPLILSHFPSAYSLSMIPDQVSPKILITLVLLIQMDSKKSNKDHRIVDRVKS